MKKRIILDRFRSENVSNFLVDNLVLFFKTNMTHFYRQK